MKHHLSIQRWDSSLSLSSLPFPLFHPLSHFPLERTVWFAFLCIVTWSFYGTVSCPAFLLGCLTLNSDCLLADTLVWTFAAKENSRSLALNSESTTHIRVLWKVRCRVRCWNIARKKRGSWLGRIHKNAPNNKWYTIMRNSGDVCFEYATAEDFYLNVVDIYQ